MSATQTQEDAVGLPKPAPTQAAAFNLGLSVCDSAGNNAEAMDKAIAYTSDYIALLTEIQSTTDDLNNTSLQDQIDIVNQQTTSDNIQKQTATYNLLSSQASAFDQQSTSEESTFNSENSNRADSLNS